MVPLTRSANYKTYWMNWPWRKKKDRFPIQTDYPVEPAFQVAGQTFYRFKDPNNIPSGRTIAVLKYAIQLKTNSDEGFLQRFYEAQKATLDAQDGKISITRLASLNNMLGDRLKWALHPGLVMKYASVVYMAEGESPYSYDESYGEEKIRFWMENTKAHDFFLTEPIRKLLLFSEMPSDQVLPYSEAVVALALEQEKELLRILSSAMPSPDSNQNLDSRITGLQTLQSYIAGRQTSTSSTSKR